MLHKLLPDSSFPCFSHPFLTHPFLTHPFFSLSRKSFFCSCFKHNNRTDPLSSLSRFVSSRLPLYFSWSSISIPSPFWYKSFIHFLLFSQFMDDISFIPLLISVPSDLLCNWRATKTKIILSSHRKSNLLFLVSLHLIPSPSHDCFLSLLFPACKSVSLSSLFTLKRREGMLNLHERQLLSLSCNLHLESPSACNYNETLSSQGFFIPLRLFSDSMNHLFPFFNHWQNPIEILDDKEREEAG